MAFFRDVIKPLAGALLITGGLVYSLARMTMPPAPKVPPPEMREAVELLPDEAAASAAEAYEVERGRDEARRAAEGARAAAVTQATDVNAWNALKRNCEQATANNVGGEYPALQQMACNRWAQFAASKGWDTGPLPEIRVAAPRSAPVQVIHQQVETREPAECPGLIAEKANIDSLMRAGYWEPQGNEYRARLHVIDLRLWQLKCKLH